MGRILRYFHIFVSFWTGLSDAGKHKRLLRRVRESLGRHSAAAMGSQRCGVRSDPLSVRFVDIVSLGAVILQLPPVRIEALFV